MKKRIFRIFLFPLLLSGVACAQQEAIIIKGNAVNSAGIGGLYQVIVINQHTSEGIMAAPNGYFTFSCLKNDTILISASGFGVKKICFRDSAAKKEFHITIRLDSIHYNLAEVTVYPHKNLREVNEERSTLGSKPNTDTYKDPGLLSPVTYLYERFSRIERSKRKVAELEDEEERRHVLKELFQIYIQHDIINLNNEQFDRFIDFCNFPDEFIKNATDYDLVMAIKYKYAQFERRDDYVAPGQQGR